MNNSRKDLLRNLCEQRLLAVTFIPGGQGSFFTRLLNHSGGVSKYTRQSEDLRLDRHATAHVGNEQWLSHCHHWDQASLINDEYFFNNLSPKTLEELQHGSGLMPFRTHPNVTQALKNVLPDLRVLYIYDNDMYRPYRLYYEKLIKPLGNDWFIEDFYRATGKVPTYLSDEIRINLLCRWFNHTSLSHRDFPEAYKLCVNDFFATPWIEYTKLVDYYNLESMPQDEFTNIVDSYTSEQWQSNNTNDIFDKSLRVHQSLVK